jgi:hypothetical protein
LIVFLRVHLNASKSTIIIAILLIFCVPSDRERESEKYASVEGKMPRYPLEMTRCSKIILFVYVLSY